MKEPASLGIGTDPSSCGHHDYGGIDGEHAATIVSMFANKYLDIESLFYGLRHHEREAKAKAKEDLVE